MRRWNGILATGYRTRDSRKPGQKAAIDAAVLAHRFGIHARALEADREAGPLQQLLRGRGEEIGLDIKVQHEDIFRLMHRV